MNWDAPAARLHSLDGGTSLKHGQLLLPSIGTETSEGLSYFAHVRLRVRDSNDWKSSIRRYRWQIQHVHATKNRVASHDYSKLCVMGRTPNHLGELRCRVIAVNADGHLQTTLNPLPPSQDNTNQPSPVVVPPPEPGIIHA
jgi:hypothetical protein